MNRVLAALIVLLCVAALPIGAYEITDWFKLGGIIEGAAFIPDGPNAGSVAIVDGFGLYLHDPVAGGYTRLWKMDALPFNTSPRGVAYVSNGPFAGAFLFSDSNAVALPGQPAPLMLISASGALIGRVPLVRADTPLLQPGETFRQGESLVAISSGPWAGKVAFIGQVDPYYRPHLYIIDVTATPDGPLASVLVDVILGMLSIPDAVGVAFLDDAYPEPALRNAFVISGYQGGRLYAVGIDAAGKSRKIITNSPASVGYEALTYLPTGEHAGRLFATDSQILNPVIRTLDGTVSVPDPIQVGLGLAGVRSIYWMKDRQQFFSASWDGSYANWPWQILSRTTGGTWQVEAQGRLEGVGNPPGMTDLTSTGRYYYLEKVRGTGTNKPPVPVRFKVRMLDGALAQVGDIPLPVEYAGTWFGRLAYVPGPTPADDRFLVGARSAYDAPTTSIYVFDSSFSTYPQVVINLAGKVSTSVDGLVYDPALERYYVMDGLRILRVFDDGWNEIDAYDLTDICPRGLVSLTKITSGPLSGSIAALNPLDNEILVVDYERDIVTAQVGNLLGDVAGSEPVPVPLPLEADAVDAGEAIVAGGGQGRGNGVANSLTKKLENARASIQSANFTAAINQVEAFQHEVSAQRGKRIPAPTADEWMKASTSIIRALRLL